MTIQHFNSFFILKKHMHSYQHLNYTKNPHTIALFNRSTRGTHGPQCKPQITHANKDQQTVKKPKYTKKLWPLLEKSQQAYCKAIKKDREKREKTFSQRQRSLSFHFLHYLKSAGIK